MGWKQLLTGGVSLGCAMFAVQGVALAQTGEEIASEGDVVVTAQRRAERLEDVPMSVTAVTPALLEAAGVTNVHDLEFIVPGTRMNFGGGFTQPSIRGITSLTVGIGFDNNVAFYVDGFYSPDTVTINSDLANIASVEVLKGPQGTLWGRNATGGAILINTLAPSDVLTGQVEVSAARFNDNSIGGYLSGPLSDRARYSIAAYSRNSDGYNRLLDPSGSGGTIGDATPLEHDSLRVKLELDVTENLVATLGYNYGLSADPRGLLFNAFRFTQPTAPPPGIRATEPYTASYGDDTYLRGLTDEGTLRLDWDTSIGTLTSYTGYATRVSKIGYDFDGTPLPGFYQTQHWTQDTFQQGLDLAIDVIDGVDLVVGGSYITDEMVDSPQLSYGGTGALVGVYHANLQTDAYAVFADATFPVTDRLSLSFGGRYAVEERSIATRTLTPAGANALPPMSNSESWDSFTGRFSARYELAESTNIYASFSQGFRSGAFNSQGAASQALLLPIRPETVDAYEIGFKTAQDNLRFDIAAFFYDYQDLHVAAVVPNPTCPTCAVVTITTNAPEAEIYGVDAQLGYTPFDRFDISAGIAYLHAEYGSFPNATGTGWNATTGTNVTGQTQDWSGQQMSRSPEWSGFVNLQYGVPLSYGDLTFALNAFYTDTYVVQVPNLWGPLAGPELANKQRNRHHAFGTLNAQMTWAAPGDRYWVSVFGRNLTDTETFNIFASAGHGDIRSYGEPRTYGVRVGYSF